MLVTVYIPTKNRLPLLKRALASVLAQDYPYIEIIVVDDGSTDGTANYLKIMERKGAIKAIFHTHSLGACCARNAAINAASGDFITGLDDDDYFQPDRISAFVVNWNNCGKITGIAGLFDNIRVLTSNGEIVRRLASVVSHRDLRSANHVSNQVFAPTSYYRNAGCFDPLMPAWQDWDLWLRMSLHFGSMKNIEMITYVMDETSVTQRITLGSETKIRYAYNRLSFKLDKLSFRERSNLIVALYRYPQIEPRILEILYLIRGGRWMNAWRSIQKFISYRNIYAQS